MDQGGCKVDEAVITTAGKRPAKFVIHTVIRVNGKSEIINSDHGHNLQVIEYVSYLKSLETVKISSMDRKGRATDNAHIERFFRTIKYDKLYLNIPQDGLHLYELCEQFINYYNKRRSHSSLGKAAPVKTCKMAA